MFVRAGLHGFAPLQYKQKTPVILVFFMTLTMPLSVFLRLLMQVILILRECLSGSALVPSGGARSRLCQHVGAWAPEALTQRRRCVWYAICSHHG